MEDSGFSRRGFQCLCWKKGEKLVITNRNSLKDPSTPRSVQGWVLVSTSWLLIMASAVIAPVLPRMTAHFRDTPNAPLLISLVATLPALFIALLAAPFGLLADRIGRRRLLLIGLAVYGVLGIAPYWLHSLQWIVTSRAGVGVTEAMVMTCSTALIGDYYSGATRERWFALQTGSASVVAMLMNVIGGVLGERGWRMPFSVYSFSFILFPLVSFLIWEPARGEAQDIPRPKMNLDRQSKTEEEPFRWSGLLGICLITFFASTAFYVVVIQLSFVLTERGYASPKLIGIGAALSGLAMSCGSALFRIIRARYTIKLAISFVLSSTGFFIMTYAHTYGLTIAGAALNEAGLGLVLPTLVTWAITTLPSYLRGRGTGAWLSSFALGQFASPLLVLALARLLGGACPGNSGLCFCLWIGCNDLRPRRLAKRSSDRPRLPVESRLTKS
jgi:MFS family permease